MTDKLLEDTLEKLLNEPDNNNKTVNGCFVFFVNIVLEERYGAPRFISERSLINYYRKHVEGKSNKSGEPSSELKNHMAVYLGYNDYIDYEFKLCKKAYSTFKKPYIPSRYLPYLKVSILFFLSFVYPIQLKNRLLTNRDNYLNEYYLVQPGSENITTNVATYYHHITITSENDIAIRPEKTNAGVALIFKDHPIKIKSTTESD